MAKKKSQLQQTYGDLRAHYSGMHNQMRMENRILERLFEGVVDVPYEVRVFKSSTGVNIVEGFRNQIRTHEPTVDFFPAGASVAARKHATLMKKWGYGMLRREREMSNMDPNRQCGFNLLRRGAACKKIVVDVDAAMEPPPKRGTEAFREWEARALRTWPFVSRAIDPLALFPSPTQKPLSFMIERQVRYAGDIEAAYPDWVNPDKKRNPVRPVEWLEYWDSGQYYTEADGNVVFSRENPYGFIPYLWEWSGMGSEDEDADPRHLAHSIITSISGELLEEVRLKTAISVQTQMHVFPPILTVEDPQKVAQQFGVGPGKVIKHPPGHPPEYMEYPPPNENMYAFLNEIKANIERVQSSALSGGREPGVRAGVLQAQLIGQSLTTIDTVIEAVDTIGTRSLNMMAAMARKLDLPMAVTGTQETEDVEQTYQVSGKDFTHQNFEVTFEAIDPAENDRALLVGEAMRRAGDISRRTLWKKYAKHVVEDPDEEELNLLEEAIMASLVESGMLTQAVLSEDVQEQMQAQAEEAVANVTETVQNRQVESVPVSAASQATELEAISGRPGSQTQAKEVAEQGMAAASPGRSGLPRS